MSQSQEPLPNEEDHSTGTNDNPPLSSTTNGIPGDKGQKQDAKSNEIQQMPDRIQIRIKDNSHHAVWFQVRQTTPLGMVMKEYHKAVRHEKTPLRFYYDGERVSEETTPASVCAP